MALNPLQTIIAAYAKAIKAALAAQPTNLELALAPTFKRLIEDSMRCVFDASTVLPTLLPEYTKAAIGRIDPARLKGHDKRQFTRFTNLPM